MSKQHSVTARDGRGITVTTFGTGPGLVVVHGGGVGAKDYFRLGRRLSDEFSVHVYDRRGRKDGRAVPSEYSLEADIDDLGAVLEATGSHAVFGHSYGAFVGLRAALVLPIAKLALYDPAVNVDNLFPTAFVEPFVAAIDVGDLPLAFAVMGEGLYGGGTASRLPLRVRTAMMRLFLRTPIGASIANLVPTVPQEIAASLAHQGPASEYRGIGADTLLAHGARGPQYYAPICAALAAQIPQARSFAVPRASHNAVNIARKGFAEPFREFLRAHESPRV